MNNVTKGIDLALIIGKIASGGPVYWIATGVCLLIVALLAWKLFRVLDGIAWNNSQQRAQNTEANNNANQQNLNQQNQQSNKTIDDIAKANPDDNKKPPVVTGDLEQ